MNQNRPKALATLKIFKWKKLEKYLRLVGLLRVIFGRDVVNLRFVDFDSSWTKKYKYYIISNFKKTWRKTYVASTAAIFS